MVGFINLGRTAFCSPVSPGFNVLSMGQYPLLETHLICKLSLIRPVFGIYKVPVKLVDEKKRDQVLDELVQQSLAESKNDPHTRFSVQPPQPQEVDLLGLGSTRYSLAEPNTRTNLN